MAVYITAQKAAEEAGVSTQTIRNWLSWKLLKGIMVTKNPSSERGRIYIDRDDLQSKQGPDLAILPVGGPQQLRHRFQGRAERPPLTVLRWQRAPVLPGGGLDASGVGLA